MMRGLSFAVLVCAAVLVACTSPRGASNDREPIRALLSADALVFVSFDSDGDLSVSAAEREAGVAREFARADTNHDNSLQPLEFQNWSNTVLGGGQTGPYRLDFDRNVDNVITAEEFAAELNGRARDYDEDQDGTLTRGEFVRLVGQARPPRDAQAPPNVRTRR